jgi:hypothetical protein
VGGDSHGKTSEREELDHMYILTHHPSSYVADEEEIRGWRQGHQWKAVSLSR